MKVFIIAAISADGYIGLNSDHLADWSSKEDKQLFVRLTKQAGVMVMGSNQFNTIGRGLPGRKTILYTSRPQAYADVEGDVETTTEDPKVLVSRLSKAGYAEVAICGGGQIYSHFLQAGVVTDLYITIEPILFGGGITLSAAGDITPLKLIEQSMLNSQTVLLHYQVG